MKSFPTKDPVEVVILAFDFAAELGAESINGAPVVSVSTYSGTDVDPAAVLYGSPAIVGQSVTQTVRAGLDGVVYKLRARIDTSGGRTLVLPGLLPVVTQ